MKTICGHGVAIITPFKKNGEIDFNAIPHIIEHLISGGVDFFVVLGTTAETASLTKEEKINLALQKEKKTGYFIPDGKYWKQMDKFDQKEIKVIDELWLSSIQKEI